MSQELQGGTEPSQVLLAERGLVGLVGDPKQAGWKEGGFPTHAPTGTPLTVSVLLEPRQLIGARQNVGLAMEAVPKGMLPVGQDVVEDAAGGEDVHPAGL